MSSGRIFQQAWKAVPKTAPVSNEKRKQGLSLHIPLEVNQQIARYLDRPSAFALTLTCKGLRDAGETRLYRTLDLTSGWVAEDGESDEPRDLTAEELLRCQDEVARRIRLSDHAINRYAYRRDCVKVLRVEPSGPALDPRRSNSRLLGIIFTFARQLERLDIVSLPPLAVLKPAPWQFQAPQTAAPSNRSSRGNGKFTAGSKHTQAVTYTTYDHNTSHAPIVDHFGFYNGLCRPPGTGNKPTTSTFTRLRTLRLCVPASVDRMVPHVLRFFLSASAPIESLHLSAAGNVWSSGEATRRTGHNMRENATPSMPTLKELTVWEAALDTRGDLLLACLLNSAENLEVLRLKEESVPLYTLNDYRPQLKLKRLICLPADNNHTYNLNRCKGLEKHVEEMVVQYTSLSELEEVTQLNLPIIPSVRRFCILTSARPSPIEYARAGVGPAPTHRGKRYPVCDFPLYLLQSIELMPDLESIMLAYYDYPAPPMSIAEYDEPDLFGPSSSWESDDGHRGLVIRQYRKPRDTPTSYEKPPSPGSTAAASAASSFVHVRSLTRVVDAFTCPTYTSFRRFWVDYASYRGHTLSRAVLDRVYAAGDMERNWTDGARGLEMSDEAWAVLDEAYPKDDGEDGDRGADADATLMELAADFEPTAWDGDGAGASGMQVWTAGSTNGALDGW